METLVKGEPEIRTVRELIDRMARTQGGAAFLISPETGRVLTFAGLQEQSRAISARLRQAGLKRGDKVAFLLDNGLFTAQLFLGTLYGGLVSVPLNVRAGVSQLAYTLDHCDAKVVFVEDQYNALAHEALAGVSRAVQVIPADVDRFAVECGTPPEDTPPATLAAEDEALLMYTSGSVGQPKGAMHSHHTVLAHGRNSICSHQLTSADRSLLVLPLYHINAECVTLIPALLSGGSVVVPHGFSVSRFWDWLDEHRCTWSAVVPTIISQLLDWQDPRADRREAAFQRIRFLRSSSAPLSPSLHREFLDKFKLLLIQAMGSSEAGNIFSNPLPPGENKIGSPGLAWGFETRIIDREGAEVPAGEPGEVLIRGPAVMQGYYKDAEGTASVLDAEGWLHTGDLAYRDQDGYFFVVGRSKELIIKGGMNIAPRQIDEVLESHPAVLEAAVVGVPDRYVGEDLVAFAVLRAGMEGDEREMLAFCESRLGHFKTPTRIHFVADLPKGPSGKVQRLRLLDKTGQAATAGAVYGNGYFARGALLVAASTIEQTIAESWAELLGQPRVAPDRNFFSLGGHSLMAIQCLSRMRAKLPVALSLSDFFENPTVAQQAALVRQRLYAVGRTGGQAPPEQSSPAWEQVVLQQIEAPAGPEPIPPRGGALPYPLSSAQQRIWFSEKLVPGVPLYNESEAVRLLGELNVDAMEQALDAIVARHEVLRTTIQITEERPMAIVHENWPLRMKRIDLSGLAPAQREAEVERLLIDERRRSYDLEAEPGIRATLLRLGSREHVFILMMHHIICDRWSMGVVWRELAALFEAFSCGKPLALPPLPIQHGDYAVWQQQRVAEADFAGDLAYWEDNLRGAPELLELPADRPRPRVQSYRGARRRFRLNATLAEALRNCSRRGKTSLFTVFAAALNTLLYRYTGSEDILLGIPIADRDRQELQSVIGFLIDTHVLRTELSAGMTFRELLARVQKGLLALYSHREVPFDQVVSRIRPERNPSHSPLFQVMLNWRDRDQQMSFIGLDGLVVESLLAENRTSKFDLTLVLTDSGDDIWLEAEYSTDLFDDERIARMFGHYQTLLEAVASDPDRRLAELPLLSDAERRQLLVEWNATEVTYPRDMCIHQLFERQVGRTPEAVAVVFGDREVTYRELNQRSSQLAHHLRKLGVEADELVGICVERSIEMVVGLLGILKAGGAYVPLDPAYPRERLAFMLRDSRAALVLTQDKLRQRLPGDSHILRLDTDWQRIAEEENRDPDLNVNAGSLAYVMYTSGSTGEPKGVEVPHRGVVRLVCGTDYARFTANEVFLQLAPLAFDASTFEIWGALLHGARLALLPPHQPTLEEIGQAIRKHRITTMWLTAGLFHLMVEERLADLKGLRQLLAGGDVLSPAHVQQAARELADGRLINGYGPTESTTFACCYSVPPQSYHERPVPIGKPIANTQVYILDGYLQPVPIGVVGELHIGGDGLARGYLNRPELTAEKFIAHPFSAEPGARLYKTGDLARYLPDGNIEFLGRIDHQVKIRGFRIELGEIEAALGLHHGVGQCVVVAREDEARDKQLMAYIVPLDPHGAPGVEELRELLKQKLPEYMVPAAFVMLEKLPLTPNGKIDRKALPAPELGPESSVAGYVAPRTPIEEALAEIWSKVLGLKQVGIRDNFFDLGGHSLLAMRLIGEIHKSLNHKLSVPAFFQNPTIEGMARVLQQAKQAKSEPQLIPLKAGTSAGTLFFLEARMEWYRIARLLNAGPASFATAVPLPSTAVEAATLNRMADLPSLENLAAAHAALIRACQRSGPCLLVGHSFGARLAFEVAHQLQREGIPVEMILLLDSWGRIPLWWQRLRALSLDRALRSLSYRASHLWSRVRARTAEGMAWLAAASQSRNPSCPGLEQANMSFDEVPWGIVEKIHRNAGKNYRHRRLDSHAVLFHCQNPAQNLRHLYAIDDKMGWGGLFTRGLEMVETPGDHMSMLQDPHIQALARRINDRLEQLRAQEAP
ncbi:MAG: amino acid adenylation domain-containing protein [Candidatus Binataceae bacterium]